MANADSYIVATHSAQESLAHAHIASERGSLPTVASNLIEARRQIDVALALLHRPLADQMRQVRESAA